VVIIISFFIIDVYIYVWFSIVTLFCSNFGDFFYYLFKQLKQKPVAIAQTHLTRSISLPKNQIRITAK